MIVYCKATPLVGISGFLLLRVVPIGYNFSLFRDIPITNNETENSHSAKKDVCQKHVKYESILSQHVSLTLKASRSSLMLSLNCKVSHVSIN